MAGIGYSQIYTVYLLGTEGEAITESMMAYGFTEKLGKVAKRESKSAAWRSLGELLEVAGFRPTCTAADFQPHDLFRTSATPCVLSLSKWPAHILYTVTRRTCPAT